MKVFPGFRVLALLALGLLVVPLQTRAQIGLTVTPSSNAVLTNTPLTYNVIAINQSPVTSFFSFVITNALSANAQIIGVSPTLNTITNGNTLIFIVGRLDPGNSASATVIVQASVAGFITNTVTAADTANTLIIPTTVTVVTAVTNAAPTIADLAIGLINPTQAVITNDYTSYGITVSNLGPNDAPGVMVTNSLAGMKFLTNSPVNLSRTFAGGNVLFNLGTLTNGAATNFTVRVQPTNAGPLALFATVGSPAVLDTNTANNTVSNSIVVGTYLSGLLMLTNVSPTQTLDPQNGLMEQAFLLSNVGTSTNASARIVLSGLTKTNWLVNAVGTNDGNPFVVCAGALNPGQTVTLLLQFYAPSRLPFLLTSNQWQAFEVPLFDLTPPVNPGTLVSNVQIFRLSSGNMLVEFPSLTNGTYNVIYGNDVSFSTALVAQPSGVASANRSQWIDYGPPETVSHPTNTLTRFYRVYLAP